MSQQQYDVNLALLGTVDELVRTQYAQSVPYQVWRAGSITNRIFKPTSDGTTATGDGLVMQSKTGRSDSSRATRQPLADFGNARQRTAAKVKLRYQDNPSSAATGNDFVRLEAVAQINEIDLRRGNDPGVAVNLAEEVGVEMRDNYADAHPILYYSTADAKFAAVNGTKKANDNITYADSSAYSSGATSFRVQIDFGSISPFKENTHWDFYSGDTLLADECRVTDQDTVDGSIGFELTTASSVANCDNVADNADIYRSGEKGQGYRGSLRSWFDAPTSGESFYGGVDRTSADYRYLNVNRYTPNSSSATTINRGHLDTLARAMSYVDDGQDDMGKLFLTNSEILDTLRKSIGEEALSNQPANNEGEYSFGSRALYYVHPDFGKVALVSDPMHPADRMEFIRAADWQLVPYLGTGLKMMPGDVGSWYRPTAASGGGGRGMYWRCEGYSLDALWCKMPKKQGVILNITS